MKERFTSQLLEWDSDFFQRRVVLIIPEPGGLAIQQIIQNDDFDMAYLQMPEGGSDQLEEIEKLGGKLFDRKCTYRKEQLQSRKIPNQVVSLAMEHWSEDFKQLALSSGHASRFKKDPMLSSHFDRLYELWIQNALNRSFGDEVLGFLDDSSQARAFVSLSKQQELGMIGLIAVDHNSQGQGWGTQLMQSAENWYIEQGCRHAEVVTQAENSGACKLYEKVGYSLDRVEWVFHFHRE